MNFTVSDLLLSKPFNEMQVIAGAAGLNNEVRFSGILDAPDSVRFVREGEFCFSSGYIFVNNPEIMVNVIEELHRHGAAALGIKIFRYIHAIPANARELADAYSLPLLFIPNKFSWHELLFPLLLNISTASENNSDFFIVYDHLVTLLQKSQSITDALNIAHELLRYPLYVISEKDFSCQSCPTDIPFPMEINEATLSKLKQASLLMSENGSVRYYCQSNPDVHLLITPLNIPEYQYLVLGSSPTPMTPNIFNQTIYALMLVREAIRSRKSQLKNLIFKKNNFLNEFFAAKTPVNDISFQSAVKLQINPNMIYCPAVARFHASPCLEERLSIYNPSAINFFDQLNQRYGIHGCMDNNFQIHLLIPVSADLQDRSLIVQYLRKSGQQIKKLLYEFFHDFSYSAIIGFVAESWQNIPQKHALILSCMDKLDMPPAESVILLHDMGGSCLLAQPGIEPYLKDFYKEYFSPIDAMDSQARQRIIETLNAYIETRFNFREAARILSLHHNTIRNRLEEFSNLTGLEITRHEDLLIILICLRIYKQK
ncbi:PucR family transcriptional regulator [Clostridium sp. AM58-1XD]|uniref:PucR family transcriptional regulator n=1 Tax=Clostridium sp. AM58-1XD TaxID=2292307 RepID=UPI000E48E467|nr:PucR family transcriptional regulator [Clostridium sp. AM58-1XD]RGY99945.1 PucR family transcriptional regulator [Clostridium sp. AM58-1XD]